MTLDPDKSPSPSLPAAVEPILDARIRLRIGRQLQMLYGPVLDEGLDPYLAALVRKLGQGDEPPEGL
ncbi:hypothetical protein [Methylobacterium sp. Leaf118]|uniref:hypothetical protein n=1 Tax=Methylobacterium sp. Leaf118 TaxID=2876562 RepID=UPI001E37FB00|nr:hypothetical protein [Methylobacterium sp. Leaf118]